MYVAIVTLAIFNLLQGYVILQLMNRLLKQAKIEPVELPKVHQPEGGPTYTEPSRKPRFSIPVTS